MSNKKVENVVIPKLIEMLEAGVANIMYFEGPVTKDPDWGTRRGEDGQVVLSDSEFVQVTVQTGESYHTVRAFAGDEALVEWALGLGGGSIVAMSAEVVNLAPKTRGGRWSTYLRAVDVQCIHREERKSGTDREGAVARRVAAEAAPRVTKGARVHA